MKKLGCCLLLVVAWQVPPASATAPDQKQLAALIALLGSDSYGEREQAARDLKAAGPAALDALKSAVKHQDAEISGRATRLVAAIEGQVHTSRLLAGKKIRLNVKDVSVFEAIRELNNLSGYPCEVIGNTSGLVERKITLDTGEVTFWEALRQLCERGRLAETATTSNVPNPKNGKVYYNNPTAARTTTILLTDGESRQLPVCLQGSVRIVALPANRVEPGETQIVLDVAGEHRLQNFGVIGTPFLTSIVDDQEQTLVMVAPEAVPDPLGVTTVVNGNGNIIMVNVVGGRVTSNLPTPVVPQRSVPVRIKLGTKGARVLREVSGTLTVQAMSAPELLVKVEGVLTAAGRSFMGKDGNGIHVQTVDKQSDGSYRVRLSLENPELQDPYAGRNVRIRGNFNGNFNNGNGNIPFSISNNMPKLVDADGKECAAEVQQMGTEYNANGQFVLIADLVYRPSAGPARLELHGQRTILFTVPFTLKNVPIS